jgi:hypothetical protein
VHRGAHDGLHRSGRVGRLGPGEPVAGAATAAADLAHADLRCCERGTALVPFEQQLGGRGGHDLPPGSDDLGPQRRLVDLAGLGVDPDGRGRARARSRRPGRADASSSTTSASCTSPPRSILGDLRKCRAGGGGCVLGLFAFGLESERDLGADHAGAVGDGAPAEHPVGVLRPVGVGVTGELRRAGLVEGEGLGVGLAGVAAGDGAGRGLLVAGDVGAVLRASDEREPELAGDERLALDDVNRLHRLHRPEVEFAAVQHGDEHVGRLVAERVGHERRLGEGLGHAPRLVEAGQRAGECDGDGRCSGLAAVGVLGAVGNFGHDSSFVISR